MKCKAKKAFFAGKNDIYHRWKEVKKGQMRGIDEAVKVQLGYYIPEQAEKKRQGKCRKEVNFDGG